MTAGEGGSVYPETGNYGNGTVITITSYPDEGYKFDRWKGTWKDDRIDQCGKGGVPREILSSSSRNCHITMVIDSNKNIQAFLSVLQHSHLEKDLLSRSRIGRPRQVHHESCCRSGETWKLD